MLIIALIATVLVGVVLGGLGSGGSILMLPVLVYLAGMSTTDAVVVSLVVVGGTSALATWLQWRDDSVHWQAVRFLAVTGIAGSLVGSRFTHLVPPDVLMLLFSVMMLVVGGLMLRRRSDAPPNPQCRPALCMSIGAAIGLLTGFLGVGGGFLIVPSLIFLAGIETPKAIGASMAIVTINAVAGVLGHLGGGTVPWPSLLYFVAAAVAGMLLGTKVADRLPAATLQRAFAWLVIAVAIAVGGANLT